MRVLAGILGISLLMLGCGVALKNYDIQTGQSDIRIDSNSIVGFVCLQSPTTKEYKCMSTSELRRYLFKE